MKAFVEFLIRSLVDNPDKVCVNEVVGASTTVYELRVADGDLGKVIGKHGRTLQALRSVLTAAGTKDNRRVLLEVLE